MVAVCSQAYYEPARWTSEEWTAALAMAKQRRRFLVPHRSMTLRLRRYWPG
jgi:hypothetical protein